MHTEQALELTHVLQFDPQALQKLVAVSGKVVSGQAVRGQLTPWPFWYCPLLQTKQAVSEQELQPLPQGLQKPVEDCL